MEHFQPTLETQVIKYTLNNDSIAEFTFDELGARYNFDELVQTAINYSNRCGLLCRMGRLLGRPHKIESAATVTVAVDKLENVFATLSTKVDVAPQNAALALEGNEIIKKPDSVGRGIDFLLAAEATNNLIESGTGGTIELILQSLPPLYTTADLDFPVVVLGSFSTRYDGNADTDPRVYNLRLASERIHNQMLYPDEVFSAGAFIGAHLPNSGYKPAIVLVRGEPVEDIGGGVCQVVSTLYNAVLLAELAIVQRHNHSAPVSYVGYGFDATVAGDYFDLKFKNNTTRPLLITSQMQRGQLIISVHGYDARPPERSIRFSANRVEILAPEPYREIVDATLPRGERFVTLESQLGYHIELLKHVYMNGQEVEVIKINTSVYKPLQGVIAIGAG